MNEAEIAIESTKLNTQLTKELTVFRDKHKLKNLIFIYENKYEDTRAIKMNVSDEDAVFRLEALKHGILKKSVI